MFVKIALSASDLRHLLSTLESGSPQRIQIRSSDVVVQIIGELDEPTELSTDIKLGDIVRLRAGHAGYCAHRDLSGEVVYLEDGLLGFADDMEAAHCIERFTIEPL